MGTRGRGGRAAAALAAVLALAMVAAGCSSSDDGEGSQGTTQQAAAPANELEPDDPPQPGGQLVFAVPAETDGWNPAVNQWADAGNFVGSSFMEPLAVFNAEGTVDPWLAESIEPVDGSDFTQWTVVVRDGIRFHDGTPLTAEVVARNLTFQYSDPRSLTTLALGDLFVGAEATGPQEVTVTFSEPWSAFPSSVAGPAGYVMADAMLDAEDAGSANPIGTGPFVFERWERERFLRVTRNTDYWRPDVPHLDAIEFQVIKDGKARKTELETGNVDMMLTNRAADIEEMADRGSTVVRDYLAEKTFVMLGTAQGPFANEHARLALAYATDRESLVAQLGEGIELRDSPLLEGSVWEVDDADAGYVAYDPAKAAEELALYTQETGEPTLSFAFSGLANLEEQQIMQILQEQWRQVGIESSIDTVDQVTLISQAVSGTFEAAYFRNYGYPDPDSDWVFWSSTTANGVGQLSINFTQYTTPEIDALLTQARSTTDQAERQAAYAEVVRLRNAAVPDVWLFNTPFALVADARVRGLNEFRTTSFANYLPKPWIADIWLER